MFAIRLGTAECVRSFQSLSAALQAHEAVFLSTINSEALEDEQGRFRVWSGNLGALQKGHSSLDYRLRDSPLLQTNVLKLLNELRANLCEAAAVVSGDRLPYEQQQKPDGSEDEDDVWSQDEDDSSDDEAPKTELEQRFLDIVDIIDNLYKLSLRIRSPTLRSRSLKAVSYRPVDPDTGIDTFEQYALFDLQHTRELLSHLRPDSSSLKDEGVDYLVERLSKAITLRRRQFKYWRRHRDKLGASAGIEDVRPHSLPEHQEVIETKIPTNKTTVGEAMNVIKAPTSELMPKSLLSGTEATQHHHSLDEVVDSQSVTSYATTTRDLTGRGIELPSPPKAANGEQDFECPYCYIICPARYGKGRAWRAHLLQDLQPYVCTYRDCKDSDQLFRSRREWSEHEAGHRKLWRCPEHTNAIFWSSTSLEDHLRREHPASFPEEQLTSIVKVGETSSIDLRKTCPICLAEATMEGGLQNHIANHLERLAAFALPKDVNSAQDESDGASSAASRGRSVGSSASQHLISESEYSDSISRQSDDVAHHDSILASKISRLASETRSLSSQPVPLKEEKVTNALSADLLGLLPDASNQKMDLFLSSSHEGSEMVPTNLSASSEPWPHAKNVMRTSRSRSDLGKSTGLAELMTQHESPPMPTLVSLYNSGRLQSHGSTRLSNLVFNEKISLVFHDITQLKVDAIVNSALPSLSPDKAENLNHTVHSTAGPGLADECRRLKGCAIGDAKITGAYNLPCTAVIHAVRPRYDKHSKESGANLLAGCYRRSLEIAVEHKLKSVAFPTLSAGGFGFPTKVAARIAIQAVRNFLDSGKGDGLDRIIFCVHTHRDEAAYDQLLPVYFPPTTPPMPETMLHSTFDNALSELPDLPVGSQQNLPPVPVSLAKDKYTESPRENIAVEEKLYYANQLNQISGEIEIAAQQLVVFLDNIPNFEEAIISGLTNIVSALRASEKLFTGSENSIRKFTGRTSSDLDLLCSVLQSVSGSVGELTIQTKYTKNFGVSTYKDLWDDFNFHLKNSHGFSFLYLLELCQNFAKGLSEILQNGAEHVDMGLLRDRLAHYRLEQTGKDAEEAHSRKFEEVLLSREFTSQSIAEVDASDMVKASQIPTLNDLYKLGRLTRVPTNSKANPMANDIICLIRHDLTRLKVDAIVNSTDRAFSGFGQLDKAVFRAAGPEMLKEISKYGICEDGSVRVTEGYQLPCTYVLHTIPPEHYRSTGPHVEAFRKCYSRALDIALQISARTIAFPAIGAGLLMYPRFESVTIAIEEVQRFLARHKPRVIDKIVFCVFEETDESVYRALLPKYFPPTSDSLKESTNSSFEGNDSKMNNTAPIPIAGAQPRQRAERSESIESLSSDEVTKDSSAATQSYEIETKDHQASGKDRPPRVLLRKDIAIDEITVQYISKEEALTKQDQQSQLRTIERPWSCCQCSARPMVTENCLICYHKICPSCDIYLSTNKRKGPSISLVPLLIPEINVANFPETLDLRHGNIQQEPEETILTSKGKIPDLTTQTQTQPFLNTFVKVHRSHLSLDTLIYYGLKWIIDELDQDYIIIPYELETRQSDILFEHTRMLRTAVPVATHSTNLGSDNEIHFGRCLAKWRNLLHLNNEMFDGSTMRPLEQCSIQLQKPEPNQIQWMFISYILSSESYPRVNPSPRELGYKIVEHEERLHSGSVLGFGPRLEDDGLPHLPLRVEFDQVEIVPETEAEIWKAARARALALGFILPDEDQQHVHFSDEATQLQKEEPSNTATDPPTLESPDYLPPAKGVLRPPTEKFPEDLDSIREGVAPLGEAKTGKGIPPGARWTKIDRRLVNPQALLDAGERFEEKPDSVVVLRVLSKDEIQKLADRTKKIREARSTR